MKATIRPINGKSNKEVIKHWATVGYSTGSNITDVNVPVRHKSKQARNLFNKKVRLVQRMFHVGFSVSFTAHI
jgi:hypothetical protein